MQSYRRRFMTSMLGTGLLLVGARSSAIESPLVKVVDGRRLPLLERQHHEYFMRLAIREAMKNKHRPFGAVLVHADRAEVMASGVNASRDNPVLHSEVVAMNDYVKRFGNRNWEYLTMYTTAEPCPMCMGALVWAGVRKVVWASSMATIRRAASGPFDCSAADMLAKAPLAARSMTLIGGILADQVDPLFTPRTI